ncbi:uncharacterized protein G2W53_021817 [Senna tora]|uniref:Uncharacterized protein n=1 Tax=Senna tora TaxID=362788 RepID=A0A834TK93_9FABA|nr:uncharacterized protein G2W53_021817 [Senna tora]
MSGERDRTCHPDSKRDAIEADSERKSMNATKGIRDSRARFLR